MTIIKTAYFGNFIKSKLYHDKPFTVYTIIHKTLITELNALAHSKVRERDYGKIYPGCITIL